MKYHNRPVRIRLRICLIAFLLAFAGLTFRVWQLQLASDRRVVKLRERQTDHRVKLSAQRGSILDAKGRELAVSLQVPSIYADPKVAELSDQSIRKLSSLLDLSKRRLKKKLGKKNHFVWLRRQVSLEVGKKIRKLKLPGIGVTTEWGRLYPTREIGAQVIGVVGVDGQGLEGVERFYDHFLEGRPLVVQADRDAKGRTIFTGDTASRESERGATLHLALDTTIQHFVENELTLSARASKSKSAMGIVMDPVSGRVLAMATYPPVNPNRLDNTSSRMWRNRPLEEVFEPGSTFKVFTLAAALEAGTLQPDQIFNCKKGSLVVRRKVIRNTHEHAWLDPSQIIKFSDNIGTARIGLAMGRDPLMDWVRRFGFGQKTGVDFPGEERGLILSPRRWNELETATVSFGQGIGVTGIQLVAALSSIANGGFSIRPHLVESATLANGERVNFSKTYEPKRFLQPKTVDLIQRWMERVTEEDGTGVQAAMSGYRVAGKTGTAQMIDPETRRYSHDLVVSSFMGYAPASNPRLAALFAFRAPEKGDFGGQLAAPAFRRAISASLAYLGVPPDKENQRVEIPIQMVSAKPLEEGIVQPSDGPPDFRGLTIREVLRRAQKLPINVSIVGTGIAVRQEGKKELTVYFANSLTGERT